MEQLLAKRTLQYLTSNVDDNHGALMFFLMKCRARALDNILLQQTFVISVVKLSKHGKDVLREMGESWVLTHSFPSVKGPSQ